MFWKFVLKKKAGSLKRSTQATFTGNTSKILLDLQGIFHGKNIKNKSAFLTVDTKKRWCQEQYNFSAIYQCSLQLNGLVKKVGDTKTVHRCQTCVGNFQVIHMIFAVQWLWNCLSSASILALQVTVGTSTHLYQQNTKKVPRNICSAPFNAGIFLDNWLLSMNLNQHIVMH